MNTNEVDTDVIYNTDAIEGLKSLPDNCIDLVVTSPPYNVGIDYDSWNDTMDPIGYFEWVSEWMSEIYRVLKVSGRVAINIPYEVNFKSSGGGRSLILGHYYIALLSSGLSFAGLIDLVEDSPQRVKTTAWGSWLSPSAPYIYNPKECVLIGYKDQWKKATKGVSYFTESEDLKKEFMNLVFAEWKYKAETRGLTKANFSLDIPEKAIKILSWEDDVVLDPFMGSGTTAVACKKLNRRYIGFDISKSYCDIAERRLHEQE